jgi:hypothetical protein
MLTKIKDKGVSAVIKKILNEKLKEFGTITELSLNKKEKEILLSLSLDGEAEELKVRINNYKLYEENDSGYICIKEIKTSREWLTKVLEKFIVNKEQSIPKEYYKAICMFF